jgi:hypothetical protein
VDIRADIYSLGATLYHMLVGRTPYVGSSAAVVMTKHLNDEVPDPREERPELSMGCVRLVEKMMAKNRADRYQTPEELIKDLDLVMAGKSPAAVRLGVGRSAVRGHGARAPVRRVSHRTTTRPSEPVRARGAVTVLAIGGGVAALVIVGALVGFFVGGNGNGNGTTLPPPPPGNGNGGENGGEDPGLSADELLRRERERRLTAQFEGICKYWEQHPLDFVKVERDFQFLGDRASGSQIKLKCQRKVLEVQEKHLEHGKERLKQAVAKAVVFEKQNRFKEAYDCFNDLPLIPAISQQAGEEQRRIKALAVSRFQAVKREALAKLGPEEYTATNRGDLAAAEAHLRTAAAFGIAEVDAEVAKAVTELRTEHDRRLKDLEKRLAEEATAARRELEKRFRALRDAVFARAAGRSEDDLPFCFGAARADAEAHMLTAEFKPFKVEADRVVRDLKALVGFRDGLRALLRARRGQQVEVATGLREETGSLEEVLDLRLGLRPRGMPRSARTYTDYVDILPGSLAKLVGLDVSKPADAYLVGLLAFYTGRRVESVEFFNTAAGAAGHKVDATYYRDFALAAWKQAREEQAGEMLAEIRRLRNQLRDAGVPQGDSRWTQLVARIEQLIKDYGDTEIVKKNLGE